MGIKLSLSLPNLDLPLFLETCGVKSLTKMPRLNFSGVPLHSTQNQIVFGQQNFRWTNTSYRFDFFKGPNTIFWLYLETLSTLMVLMVYLIIYIFGTRCFARKASIFFRDNRRLILFTLRLFVIRLNSWTGRKVAYLLFYSFLEPLLGGWLSWLSLRWCCFSILLWTTCLASISMARWSRLVSHF